MRWKKISDAVVRRLPLYLRVLEEASREGNETMISSERLGQKAGVSSALVRKDLAWFGEFGKQGVGYEIKYLRDELRRILNLEQEIRVALVGVGSLGQALTRYNLKRYFRDENFCLRMSALFDNDPERIGKKVDGLEVYPMNMMGQKIAEEGITMAIITVPAEAAQSVANALVQAGIKAILNFAPTKINVPDDVHLANADLSLELQRLAYYLGE